MKLNKVMALALSGLMAVSMLAGCSNGTPNGEENGEQGQQTPATNAVSVMNDAQKVVDFESDSKISTALSAILSDATTADIKGVVSYDAILVDSGRGVNQGKDLLSALQQKISNVDDAAPNYSKAPTSLGQTTTVNMYMVKADGLSEEQAVKNIAKAVNADSYVSSVKKSSGKDWAVDYNGAIAVEKVTRTNEDGDTYSAYVAVVSITQTVSETSNNIG